ncbi:MAG: hypothetical protein OXG15_06430 [Gammaproteobacteria bacterium]|nr:hypothetical protein [Gammaproteobacteria bacterium]
MLDKTRGTESVKFGDLSSTEVLPGITIHQDYKKAIRQFDSPTILDHGWTEFGTDKYGRSCWV